MIFAVCDEVIQQNWNPTFVDFRLAAVGHREKTMHYTIFILTYVPNPCKMSNWRWERANLLCKSGTGETLAMWPANTCRTSFFLTVEQWCWFHAGKSEHTKWILVTFTALISAFRLLVSCVIFPSWFPVPRQHTVWKHWSVLFGQLLSGWLPQEQLLYSLSFIV